MNVSSIAEVVMKTFDSVLDTAFEGLDDSTIVDPHRCEVLKAIHSLLPARDDIARVVATRAALERLICISSGMQEAQTTLGSKSQKRDGDLVVADREQASLADVLETTAAKLSSMEKQRVEKMTHFKALKVQMEEVENALNDIEEGVTELKSTQSSKQAEAKKLRDTLSEANAKTTQEIKALQQKISVMGDEIGPIIENVKKLRSV
jgi:chromosome segregation ATPase